MCIFLIVKFFFLELDENFSSHPHYQASSTFRQTDEDSGGQATEQDNGSQEQDETADNEQGSLVPSEAFR